MLIRTLQLFCCVFVLAAASLMGLVATPAQAAPNLLGAGCWGMREHPSQREADMMFCMDAAGKASLLHMGPEGNDYKACSAMSVRKAGDTVVVDLDLTHCDMGADAPFEMVSTCSPENPNTYDCVASYSSDPKGKRDILQMTRVEPPPAPGPAAADVTTAQAAPISLDTGCWTMNKPSGTPVEDFCVDGSGKAKLQHLEAKGDKYDACAAVTLRKDGETLVIDQDFTHCDLSHDEPPHYHPGQDVRMTSVCKPDDAQSYRCTNSYSFDPNGTSFPLLLKRVLTPLPKADAMAAPAKVGSSPLAVGCWTMHKAGRPPDGIFCVDDTGKAALRQLQPNMYGYNSCSAMNISKAGAALIIDLDLTHCDKSREIVHDYHPGQNVQITSMCTPDGTQSYNCVASFSYDPNSKPNEFRLDRLADMSPKIGSAPLAAGCWAVGKSGEKPGEVFCVDDRGRVALREMKDKGEKFNACTMMTLVKEGKMLIIDNNMTHCDFSKDEAPPGYHVGQNVQYVFACTPDPTGSYDCMDVASFNPSDDPATYQLTRSDLKPSSVEPAPTATGPLHAGCWSVGLPGDSPDEVFCVDDASKAALRKVKPEGDRYDACAVMALRKVGEMLLIDHDMTRCDFSHEGLPGGYHAGQTVQVLSVCAPTGVDAYDCVNRSTFDNKGARDKRALTPLQP